MGEQGETEREGSRVEDSLLLAHDGERENENEKLSSNIVMVVELFGVRVRRLREDALGWGGERAEVSLVGAIMITWNGCRSRVSGGCVQYK